MNTDVETTLKLIVMGSALTCIVFIVTILYITLTGWVEKLIKGDRFFLFWFTRLNLYRYHIPLLPGFNYDSAIHMFKEI